MSLVFPANASEDSLRLLAACRLFDGIDRAILPSVLEKLGAVEKKRQKGEFFFREGEPAENAGILLSGRAQILRDDYDGRRHVLAELAPGDVFGEVFACAAVKTYPVYVEAVCEAKALFVNLALLEQNRTPDAHEVRLLYNLLFVTAQKNLLLNRKIELLSKRTTREKLASFLWMKAKEAGNEQFTVPFDRQSLADYLGVERSAMCSELSRMRRDGWIDYHKNVFRIQKAAFAENTEESR